LTGSCNSTVLVCGYLGCRRGHPDLWSGAEEVVVDVLLSLVAEKRDDVPQARAACPQLAGGGQVRTGTSVSRLKFIG